MVRTAITSEPIDAAALLAEVSAPANGACVLFVGTVREQNDGRGVSGIDYAAYESMAESELARIASECSERFGTPHVVIVHRIGHLEIGEASVVIATAHPHRGQAYDASRYIIEELKKRLPVWKREEYLDGTREWVRSREADRGGHEPVVSADAVSEHADRFRIAQREVR